MFQSVYLKISCETFIVIAAAQRVMSVRLHASAHRTDREGYPSLDHFWKVRIKSVFSVFNKVTRFQVTVAVFLKH